MGLPAFLNWLDPLFSGISRVLSNGTSLPAQGAINFIGGTVEDDPDNSCTNVHLGGGSGSVVQSVVSTKPAGTYQTNSGGVFTTVWTASITMGGSGANHLRGRLDLVLEWNNPQPAGATIRLLLDGGGTPFVDWPVQILDNSGTGPGSISFGFLTSALAPGVHTIAIQASDAAPNDGNTEIPDSWNGHGKSAVLWLEEIQG